MTQNATEPVYWTEPQKVAFRFFMILFLLYIFFNPNGLMLFSIAGAAIQPFHKLIPWLAKHVLHLAKPITIFTNGSGDTTYDYLVILFITILSASAALVWSVTDRRSRNYNKMFYWLCTLLRYYMGFTMLSYGLVKVIKLQFPSPGPLRLLEPFGNASPMGLAWTFLGYSKGYNYFTGMAEVSCGLLLLFRKTTTLGAVLGLVVAGNIMAINYCFDVPVKILSTALVVMSLFLLAKDAPRLFNFFLFNKVAPPSNISPHRFKAKWINITLMVVKGLMITYVLVGSLVSYVQAAQQFGDMAKKPPFYGIYNVVSFVRNHDTIAPLITDTSRWNKMLVNRPGTVQLKMMNDSVKIYNFKPQETKHVMTMFSDADTLNKHIFSYTEPAPGVLIINGKWNKDSLKITLHKYDLNNFLLLKRGFHWVNERPFNK